MKGSNDQYERRRKEVNIWKRIGVKFKKPTEGKAAEPFSNWWWVLGIIVLVLISLIRNYLF
ncbi:MAG TPA: hypothetical protein GX687_03505 [Clostridia bacterium]|nr:hypothetical protein [Clostridia bacterium]